MIAIIDFEASAFTGYPIEVGVAVYDPDRPYLSVWSSLIKPTVEWLEFMQWDQRSAQVHGITRAEIMKAPSAFDVGRQLNALLGPIGVAYCDGGSLDQRWLSLLMRECPEAGAFRLDGMGGLGRALGVHPSFLAERDDGPPLDHRAGSDAERFLRRALKLANRE